VHTLGKGRKERLTPLVAHTASILRPWLAERAGTGTDPLFPTVTGRRLSRDAIEHRIALYSQLAGEHCPSLRTKHPTAHTLRHYVDGWVMWPAGVFPLTGLLRVPVPAT